MEGLYTQALDAVEAMNTSIIELRNEKDTIRNDFMQFKVIISVLLNIFVSVFYFKTVGFIIIPIATTISSWFNSILLFIFLKKQNLFYFNLLFINRFVKIVIASVIMGLFFN